MNALPYAGVVVCCELISALLWLFGLESLVGKHAAMAVVLGMIVVPTLLFSVLHVFKESEFLDAAIVKHVEIAFFTGLALACWRLIDGAN